MLALLVLAIATASPSIPASPQPSSPPAAKSIKTAVGPDTVICKSVIATGTRFMSKDCRTKADWDEMAAQSHQLVSTSQGSAQPH